MRAIPVRKLFVNRFSSREDDRDHTFLFSSISIGEALLDPGLCRRYVLESDWTRIWQMQIVLPSILRDTFVLLKVLSPLSVWKGLFHYFSYISKTPKPRSAISLVISIQLTLLQNAGHEIDWSRPSRRIVSCHVARFLVRSVTLCFSRRAVKS